MYQTQCPGGVSQMYFDVHCGSKNAPTLTDYNYDPVQSILIIFSKLFVNDNKSCAISSVISAK